MQKDAHGHLTVSGILKGGGVLRPPLSGKPFSSVLSHRRGGRGRGSPPKMNRVMIVHILTDCPVGGVTEVIKPELESNTMVWCLRSRSCFTRLSFSHSAAGVAVSKQIARVATGVDCLVATHKHTPFVKEVIIAWSLCPRLPSVVQSTVCFPRFLSFIKCFLTCNGRLPLCDISPVCDCSPVKLLSQSHHCVSVRRESQWVTLPALASWLPSGFPQSPVYCFWS